MWIVEDAVGCNVDRLMSQIVAFLEIFQPWMCIAIVHGRLQCRGLEEGMGERGSNSFSLRNFGEIYLFEPRKFNLWLASSMLLAFLLSAFHWPWHWGLILNYRSPGRSHGYMVLLVMDKIGISLLTFLYLNLMEIFRFQSFTYIGSVWPLGILSECCFYSNTRSIASLNEGSTKRTS